MTKSQVNKTEGADYGMLLLVLLGVFSLAAPQFARAEGAVRSLDCRMTQSCDAEGSCGAASEEISFRMAPENLREDGSGKYTISYQDTEAGMEASSYAGPFYWTTDTERSTLLASSETQFLWHRLLLTPTPAASIHFLNCKLQ